MNSFTTVLILTTSALAAPISLQARALPPGAQVDPATSRGVFGPFTPVKVPSPAATGAPTTVSQNVAAALQQACDNWSRDTGIVSGFQDAGLGLTGQAFNNRALAAFKAEVDELTWKGILDRTILTDPQVSIANLTLTNGVFQSVVDNLDIMSVQGKPKQNLIDAINQVRCTQILPSIDTYMAVAARLIGPTATLRKAIRPAACAGILAQQANNPAAFPNVPNVPGGTPLGQQAPASAAGSSTTTGGRGRGRAGAANAGNGNAATGTATTGTTNGNTNGRNGGNRANGQQSQGQGQGQGQQGGQQAQQQGGRTSRQRGGNAGN